MDDENQKENTNGASSLINQKVTVIFFHGNSGNIGNRIDFAKNYVDRANVNVMIGKNFY